jgi:NAD(P)-dependent dehydrogenase (short-subunit alcohol dehydrogenase family)
VEEVVSSISLSDQFQRLTTCIGIGLMMARALALNGAHKIYIVGRRKEVLEDAAKSVSTNNIIPLIGDVTSKESMASVVNHIKSEIGYINLLIANSGVGGPQASKAITESTSIEEFAEIYGSPSFEEMSKTFEVNTVAVMICVTAFLPLLDAGNKKGNLEQKSQIIATSSIGGFNRKIPAGFVYGQSKAATTHLVKQMATQLTQWNIRANALAPGCEYFPYRSEFQDADFRKQCSPPSWQHPLSATANSQKTKYLWRELARKKIWQAVSCSWLPELELMLQVMLW